MPRAQLTCTKSGGAEVCSLSCSSNALFLAGTRTCTLKFVSNFEHLQKQILKKQRGCPSVVSKAKQQKKKHISLKAAGAFVCTDIFLIVLPLSVSVVLFSDSENSYTLSCGVPVQLSKAPPRRNTTTGPPTCTGTVEQTRPERNARLCQPLDEGRRISSAK